MTMSGCGNCLLLQLKVPTARRHQQLKDFYRELVLKVRRTRDGAQVKNKKLSKLPLDLPYGLALYWRQCSVSAHELASVSRTMNAPVHQETPI